MHFIQEWLFGQIRNEYFVEIFKNYDETVLSRIEVFMIIVKYHIINYVINDRLI
jgi:hypothetical protein